MTASAFLRLSSDGLFSAADMHKSLTRRDSSNVAVSSIDAGLARQIVRDFGAERDLHFAQHRGRVVAQRLQGSRVPRRG
jgi:hypothetical protein